MESILTSIKKLLGISEEDTHFDTDIIMHINSEFMTLNQLGIGPIDGFTISDATSTWSDYIPDNMTKVEGIKTYIYIKVKMVFDPSGSGSVNDALKRRADELEWRLTNHL